MPRAPRTLAALTVAGALLIAPAVTASALGRAASSSVSAPPMRKLRPGRYTLILEKLAAGGLRRSRGDT
jgi:hypothetical protein